MTDGWLRNAVMNFDDRFKNDPYVAGFDYDLSNLGLSVRCENCLKNNGYKTIRDVLSADQRELLQMPNFGLVSLHELYSRIDNHLSEWWLVWPEREKACDYTKLGWC